MPPRTSPKLYRAGDTIAPLATNLQLTGEDRVADGWFIGVVLIGFMKNLTRCAPVSSR